MAEQSRDYIGEYRRLTGTYIGKHSRRGLTGAGVLGRVVRRVVLGLTMAGTALTAR
ncbi:MAG TPA: hypothetical protein VHK27_15585 [Gammaproteobacteria bacterium]|nr:hypothetical protein [Gammaproteobacteria bacterium]